MHHSDAVRSFRPIYTDKKGNSVAKKLSCTSKYLNHNFRTTSVNFGWVKTIRLPDPSLTAALADTVDHRACFNSSDGTMTVIQGIREPVRPMQRNSTHTRT